MQVTKMKTTYKTHMTAQSIDKSYQQSLSQCALRMVLKAAERCHFSYRPNSKASIKSSSTKKNSWGGGVIIVSSSSYR